MRASFFDARGVIDMLESNYKTYCAVKEIMPEEGNFADMVKQVLDETESAENRAAKMDIDDLLKLLAAFHEKGIHFS